MRGAIAHFFGEPAFFAHVVKHQNDPQNFANRTDDRGSGILDRVFCTGPRDQDSIVSVTYNAVLAQTPDDGIRSVCAR